MATDAQINTNRANAQKSTGPKSHTARHSLQANPTTILKSKPIKRSQNNALKAKLPHQIFPEGELELHAERVPTAEMRRTNRTQTCFSPIATRIVIYSIENYRLC